MWGSVLDQAVSPIKILATEYIRTVPYTVHTLRSTLCTAVTK